MSILKKGFTIIELLVIIAIIGIVSSIGGSTLINNYHKGTVAKLQHNLGVSRKLLLLESYKDLEYPNLLDADTQTLEKYHIYPTPPFKSVEGFKYSANSIINESRNNQGGWIYKQNTGELYANLPNGAYTSDDKYEIWSNETTDDDSSIDDDNGDSDEDNDGGVGEDNTPDNEDFNPNNPNWDEAILGGSYFTGAGGWVYEEPSGSGVFVVDIQPNVGWLDNFVKEGKLTGNYHIYIDDKLVNSGYQETTNDGNAISAPSYKQETGSHYAKNLKVAFEYVDKDGNIEILYGEIELNSNATQNI